MSSEVEPTKRECPVADALGVVGDRYTLLLIRELSYGYHRFTDLQAYTGAPRNLLTGRLRMLEEAGVVTREQYSEHPPRFEYHLTPAGLALVPIVLALKEWSELHVHDGEQLVTFRHTCGAELHPRITCASCGDDVRAGEMTVAGGSRPPADLLA